MDFISHALWGGIAAGRKDKRSYWQAFFFGMAPDVLSFGVFFVMVALGFAQRPDWRIEPPQDDIIPRIIFTLYDVTHSFIIFGALFFLLWLIFRRPIWTFMAWGVHIVMDIFSHSEAFFPTPFLWPVSDYYFSGIPWSRPIIFIPNVVLLASLYLWFYISKRRNLKKIALDKLSASPSS
ncbi:MAG: hypothetical protein HYV68_01495 [Candidatus Taylorbacteria bacterium]|nr:hypothetical protein [Candidatus Taylorbacteria bacterium]